MMNVKMFKDPNAFQSVWASFISLTSLMSNSDLRYSLPSYLKQSRDLLRCLLTLPTVFLCNTAFLIINMLVRRVRVADRLGNSR